MNELEREVDAAAYWEARLQQCDLGTVGYSGLGAHYNRWLYRVRAAVFRRLVRQIPLDWPHARVLDVGSGTGFYITEWLRLGATGVVGSDITAASTDRLLQEFPGIRFVRWDVAAAPPFQHASFDAISAFDVLFHIVDDVRYHAALVNISSLLREGGYVLFSENFVHGPPVRTKHQASRSLERIEALLADVGLEVRVRRPVFVVMNAPVDSTNRLQLRVWNLTQRIVVGHSKMSGLVGALLYPLELALTAIVREGPSTEMMVCQKRRAVSTNADELTE